MLISERKYWSLIERDDTFFKSNRNKKKKQRKKGKEDEKSRFFSVGLIEKRCSVCHRQFHWTCVAKLINSFSRNFLNSVGIRQQNNRRKKVCILILLIIYISIYKRTVIFLLITFLCVCESFKLLLTWILKKKSDFAD